MEVNKEILTRALSFSGRGRLTAFSAAGALLVLGILGAGNVLSRYAYLRLDFSEGRIYSLSPASRQLLARLEDPVYVTAYFSPALPPQYAAARDYLENLLKEYAAYSRGRLRYEFFAAADPEKFREAAIRAGIYPIRFNILEKERYEVREAFLGLEVKYLDKKEVLPFLQDTTGLEYDLTGRLKKMLRPRKKVLGLASGNGAMSVDDLPRAVRAKLEESYDTKPVDLVSESTDVLEGIDALAVLGPTQRLEDRALFRLDQALLGGKPVALALDVKRVDMRSFLGSPLDLGLDGWLRHEGLTLRKNLVLDMQNQKVSISAQQGWMQITNIVDYPAFVLATDLNAEHPVTKGLDSLVLPYAGAVEISTGPGMRVTPLARSSRRSWMRSEWDRQFARLSPFEAMGATPEDPKGPFLLAAALEGRFTSYFPEPPKTSTKTKTTEPFLKEAKAPGRLLVVGTSRFIHQDFPLPETNAAFFLNLADWLAQDPEMIEIRTKAVAFRPLREIAPEAKTAVRYANMFGGSLAVVALGLLRWRRRRARIAESLMLYRP